MYNAMTLEQIATQARATKKASRDVVANTAGIRAEFSDGVLYLVSNEPTHPLSAVLNDVAQGQLATRFGIPQRYFERCIADDREIEAIGGRVGLSSMNANHWMHREPKDVMIRTIEGEDQATARAVLSNRYLRLDNHEMLNAFFEGIEGAQRPSLGRVGVLGGNITDRRMYVNLLFEGTEFDLAAEGERPDPHYLGVCFQNSEVGYGAVAAYAFIYRSYCTNGLVFGKRDLLGFERKHVGQVRGHGELSPETHDAIRKVILSSCGDVARAVADPAQRERLIRPLRNARQSAKVEHVEPAFTELAKTVGLTDTERSAALEHFIREQDYTQFGAAQAITWLSNDAERGGERVQELAEIGGEVISMRTGQWDRITMAA